MEYPCYTRALPHSCHAMPHPAMPTLPCYPCRAILMTCCSSPMPCHAAPHTHAMPCPCHVTPVPCNAHIIPMAWHASCPMPWHASCPMPWHASCRDMPRPCRRMPHPCHGMPSAYHGMPRPASPHGMTWVVSCMVWRCTRYQVAPCAAGAAAAAAEASATSPPGSPRRLRLKKPMPSLPDVEYSRDNEFLNKGVLVPDQFPLVLHHHDIEPVDAATSASVDAAMLKHIKLIDSWAKDCATGEGAFETRKDTPRGREYRSLRVLCSNAGEKRESRKVQDVTAHRNSRSIRCGCTWYVTVQQALDPVTGVM